MRGSIIRRNGQPIGWKFSIQPIANRLYKKRSKIIATNSSLVHAICWLVVKWKGVGFTITNHTWGFGPHLGLRSLWVRSPSLLSKSSPLLSPSKRPTGWCLRTMGHEYPEQTRESRKYKKIILGVAWRELLLVHEKSKKKTHQTYLTRRKHLRKWYHTNS